MCTFPDQRKWSGCFTFHWLNLIWSLLCVQLQGFSSVQFSRSVVSDSLRPHELQHARLPCPSPSPLCFQKDNDKMGKKSSVRRSPAMKRYVLCGYILLREIFQLPWWLFSTVCKVTVDDGASMFQGKKFRANAWTLQEVRLSSGQALTLSELTVGSNSKSSVAGSVHLHTTCSVWEMWLCAWKSITYLKSTPLCDSHRQQVLGFLRDVQKSWREQKLSRIEK